MTKIIEEEFDDEDLEDQDELFGDLDGSHDSDKNSSNDYKPPDIEDQIDHVESVAQT